MQVLLVLADIVLLNFVWLFFSIPIFTLGISSAAMFTVAGSICEGGGVRVLPIFWETVKGRFRSCLLPTILSILCCVVLAADYIYIGTLETILRPILFGFILFLTLLFAMEISVLFPLLGSYQINWKTALQASFEFCFTSFSRVIALAVLKLLPIILFLFSSNLFLFLIPMWVGCYFSGVSCLSVKLISSRMNEFAFQKGFEKIKSEYNEIV